MIDLDDSKKTGKLDSGGMLSILDQYVDGFLGAYKDASRARLAAPASLGNVLIVGMGGSGIGGNLVSALLRAECPVPITIAKDYQVPAFVGPRTLVIAVSYSGNTEETLHVALEAKARGATLIGISSGGALQKLAREKGTHLPVQGGFQPRVALPYLFGTILGATNALKLTTTAPDAALERELRAFHKALLPSSTGTNNPAKAWGRAMSRSFSVWYGAGLLAPVALRARCQVNENAKLLSRNDELPEANHNELVAWNAVEEPKRYFVGLLRQPDEPNEIANRFAFVERILKKAGVPHETFKTTATSPLGRVLQGILFVDYVSVYAALARGVDPNPVDIIADLKDILGKSGKAPEIKRKLG